MNKWTKSPVSGLWGPHKAFSQHRLLRPKSITSSLERGRKMPIGRLCAPQLPYIHPLLNWSIARSGHSSLPSPCVCSAPPYYPIVSLLLWPRPSIIKNLPLLSPLSRSLILSPSSSRDNIAPSQASESTLQ